MIIISPVFQHSSLSNDECHNLFRYLLCDRLRSGNVFVCSLQIVSPQQTKVRIQPKANLVNQWVLLVFLKENEWVIIYWSINDSNKVVTKAHRWIITDSLQSLKLKTIAWLSRRSTSWRMSFFCLLCSLCCLRGTSSSLEYLPPLWKRRAWYRYSHFEELPETILSCLLPVLRIIPTGWSVSISRKLLCCSTSFHRTAPSQKTEPQQHCQVLSPTDFREALIIYLLVLLEYHPTPKEQSNYYKPCYSWNIWAVIATLTLSKSLIAFRLNPLVHACAVVISCPSQR